MSSAATRRALPFEAIAERLRHTVRTQPLGELQAVVALARGGLVLGALAAYELQLPLRVLRLRYRDDSNRPLAAQPSALGPIPEVRGQRVLLVDDVSVSGASLRAAQALLGCSGPTLVAKGRPGAADWVLFDDIPECVDWPWQVAGALGGADGGAIGGAGGEG